MALATFLNLVASIIGCLHFAQLGQNLGKFFPGKRHRALFDSTCRFSMRVPFYP